MKKIKDTLENKLGIEMKDYTTVKIAKEQELEVRMLPQT